MAIFDGIRLIDLSQGIAGALTSLLLAEQGADVIKVEPPGGDPYRQTEAGFFIWNRSKRSVTLDLDDRRQRESFDRLLESADVLLDSCAPAQSKSFNLEPESLRSRFPHLVHCRLTAYGSDHPWKERPAIDALVAARLGLYFQQPGIRRDGPTFLYCPFPSHGAAFSATLGICAALRVRMHSGRGQFVDTSLLDGTAIITCMLWQWADHPTPEFAEAANSIEPFPQFLYECGDGLWLHHMMTDKGNLGVVADLIGVELPKPPPGSRIIPVEGRRQFIAEAGKVFKTRPREEWIRLLRERDVPVEGVVPTEETLASRTDPGQSDDGRNRRPATRADDSNRRTDPLFQISRTHQRFGARGRVSIPAKCWADFRSNRRVASQSQRLCAKEISRIRWRISRYLTSASTSRVRSVRCCSVTSARRSSRWSGLKAIGCAIRRSHFSRVSAASWTWRWISSHPRAGR